MNGEQALTDQEEQDFEQLLDYIKRNRGFDFTGYKRSSLIRRVAARMRVVESETFATYLDLLQVDPQEFTALFDTILINVTSFFRDPVAWEALARDVIPRVLESKPPPEPIRVWSAGCASGEEAYTLAILLTEALGPDATRDRVKIYGTDVDEPALAVARHATYSTKALSGVPDDLLPKYFERSGTNYVFRKDLRRNVIFGRHDLVHSAPISHIDLLVCRNTIMYLNSETQARVLARLHFALEDHGILFLGKAEMLLSHNQLFSPLDPKQRIFAKVTKDSLRDRVSIINEGGGYEPVKAPIGDRHLRELAADAVPAAVVVVQSSGTVALANAEARRLFGVTADDIGRPFQDLEISYRPAELRSALEQAQKEQRPIVLEHVPWPEGPESVDCLDIHLVPVSDSDGTTLGVAFTFIDVSLTQRLHEELERSNRDLETAYEELQSTNEELETTNEELQSTIEELETTNEELQSTIEELETTNEELQSTNEELETMNSGLHSTNEEFQTISDELRLRTGELDEMNDFLEALLTSQRGGLVVIDPDMRISVWNGHSTELWGLRSDEAPGQHFLNLDIGLPVDELRQPLKAVLSGDSPEETMVLAATNRRGRELSCQVTLTPLVNRDGSVRGAIVLMQELV